MPFLHPPKACQVLPPCQEDLYSFLAIAEEIKLKGLTGQSTHDLAKEQETNQFAETDRTEVAQILKACKPAKNPNLSDPSRTSMELAIPDQSRTDVHALDEKVKSMMEKGQKMIPHGKKANGTSNQTMSWICKLCGKEGLSHHIRDHIEANHLEGISLPCDFCAKTFSARINLTQHSNKFHK